MKKLIDLLYDLKMGKFVGGGVAEDSEKDYFRMAPIKLRAYQSRVREKLNLTGTL